MHELSIAMSLLDVVAEELERQGGGRVVAIHMKLGPLSGVVKEALCSAYVLAREGTEMEDAELVVEEVPIVAFCGPCGGARPIVSVLEIVCPDCGEPTPEIINGRELEVVGLEIAES
jgi:hydrogenase nickel incorporation protein HypA/HybF